TVKSADNGKVTTDPANAAAAGEDVKIKPAPDKGYAVGEVTVKDSKGKTVKTTEKNGTYTFTMPEDDVTVEVTFTETAIKVTEPEHGKVTVTPAEAKPGEEVKIKAEPNDRYAVDKVTVKDGKGKTVTTKTNSDGTYTFTMPVDGPVTVEVTFKETKCPSAPFTDVDISQWYHDGVDYAIENKLMNGVAAKRFDPNGSLTRAMFVTIIYRLEGEPSVSGANAYSDVVSGSWYDRAVKWASDKGIVNGYSSTVFGPEDEITREQMAAVMMRYAQYKGVKTTQRANLNSYVDYSSISSWALENMRWANAVGLITGRSRTVLAPLANTNRAEAATILMRFKEDVL
ncbi:MAG: S-layer homology domain-containing protein, partial [Firmicutes bacterium]|nr:S-layer homology domain-containing protein [Bacillota bacterium]